MFFIYQSVCDDGRGMPAQATETESDSIGVGIIEASATQLGGSLEVGHRGGTSLTVNFKNR